MFYESEGTLSTVPLFQYSDKKFYVENSVKSRIEGSAEINIHDTTEIAEAAWLTREEIHKKYNGVSITNEMVARFKFGEDFENHLGE